jgi:hypothetical protein
MADFFYLPSSDSSDSDFGHTGTILVGIISISLPLGRGSEREDKTPKYFGLCQCGDL